MLKPRFMFALTRVVKFLTELLECCYFLINEDHMENLLTAQARPEVDASSTATDMHQFQVTK